MERFIVMSWADGLAGGIRATVFAAYPGANAAQTIRRGWTRARTEANVSALGLAASVRRPRKAQRCTPNTCLPVRDGLRS